ncbi:MAG: DUF1972 domain-containing protein [Desulfobulbaceae bacterium]|nr:DUF1972 domain-containing protein [Desulfobulbaceae bacterium]
MKLIILGTRGIPANHGGFETFAEGLSLYLVNKGWEVLVYCQEKGDGPIYEEKWRGVTLVRVPVSASGALETVLFDWKCTKHATELIGPKLVLGYNTAVFSLPYRCRGQRCVLNMDGIEWKRGKWGLIAKCWFFINEKIALWFGHHLIADHPEIKNYLSRLVNPDKITVIPYTAEILEYADESQLQPYNLLPNRYSLIIARPEPENSILEIVRAYSRKKRNQPLVILGDYIPELYSYHRQVLQAASDDVIFVGALYEKELVNALRFYCRFYIHGHTVGGTNPSLVEALGAGSPVLAHDNKYNRWVAGAGARYFTDEDHCALVLDELLDSDHLMKDMSKESRRQIELKFTEDKVYGAYEKMFALMQSYDIYQRFEEQSGLVKNRYK